MPAHIAEKPRLTSRGTVALGAEVSPDTREGLVKIAQRRGESLRTTISKALTQYVAADARRK